MITVYLNDRDNSEVRLIEINEMNKNWVKCVTSRGDRGYIPVSSIKYMEMDDDSAE